MANLPDCAVLAAEVERDERRRLEETTARVMEQMSVGMLRAHRRSSRAAPPPAVTAGGAFEALSDGAVALLAAACAPPFRRSA